MSSENDQTSHHTSGQLLTLSNIIAFLAFAVSLASYNSSQERNWNDTRPILAIQDLCVRASNQNTVYDYNDTFRFSGAIVNLNSRASYGVNITYVSIVAGTGFGSSKYNIPRISYDYHPTDLQSLALLPNRPTHFTASVSPSYYKTYMSTFPPEVDITIYYSWQGHSFWYEIHATPRIVADDGQQWQQPEIVIYFDKGN